MENVYIVIRCNEDEWHYDGEFEDSIDNSNFNEQVFKTIGEAIRYITDNGGIENEDEEYIIRDDSFIDGNVERIDRSYYIIETWEI